MAIGTHVARFALVDDDHNTKTPRSKRIAVNSLIPNTAGNPTVEDYVALEAADNYIPVLTTETSIITMSAADINSAS